MGVVRLHGGTLFFAREDVHNITFSTREGHIIFKKGRLYYVQSSSSQPDLFEVSSELSPSHLWNPQEFPESMTECVYVLVSSEAQVNSLNELRGLYGGLKPLPAEAEYLNVNRELFRTKVTEGKEHVILLSWLEFTRAMVELTQRLPEGFVKPRGKISLTVPAKEVEDLEEPLIKFEGKIEGLPEKSRMIVPEPEAKVEYIKPDWAETGYKEKEGKTTYELDWGFIRQIAERMDANKGKYPRYNWQKPMEDPRDLLAAAQRHLTALHEGILEDAGRPLGHIEGAACNLMMYFAQVKIDKN